ncbi:SDR family NAD(P)-dependent oxidoreductase [Rhodococcus sp. G-MC3]|uniref:SDR family NAD(P)-dependent oxidoreductase n=1 Tax=Rhodococcus sp. G-MC3 TaxID=3046209 RepID=UPI0024BB527B|nr:SDR family NAD(P)-dependent oxidoreductase [Rhodococcus sp. G-MC3]MDJ0392641.1 SDR family NAD(P)-dependent oxidoreductase [Rhodococcus sp. G-MC3]
MKTFTHRTAAVTGAGSGIGRALAVRLANEGADLALSDIDGAGLARTQAMIRDTGVEVTGTVLDVADRGQVDSWAADSAQHFGAVHLVFNNAGVAQSGSVQGNSYADFEWVLNINLWGVIHGTKAFLPYLIEAGEGHIINTSSVFGLQAQPGVSAYNTSKFAVRGFTEALRQELDLLDDGVSATCVHPGGIRTEIVRSARVGDGLEEIFGQGGAQVMDLFDTMLLTSADRAAAVILKGVRRDARRVLIGADAHLLDLEQRLVPGGYQRVNTSIITGLGWILDRLAGSGTDATTTHVTTVEPVAGPRMSARPVH